MVDAFMSGYAAGRASMQAPEETPLEEDPPLDRVEYVSATPTGVDLQPAAPAPALRPFDSAVAYAAVGCADLGSCKPAPGYVHATVSFSPDGSASGVSVALPPGSSSDSRICADAVLRETRIAAFSGTTPATVHRALYIPAGL